jgi:cyclic beta-1,2-glucan synthetase
MRRFHGHFFNWYDLNELRVLEPGYVSTVDSGNFAGHLIALKQACYEVLKDPTCSELDAKRLKAIAERAHAYAVGMDFRFLFDMKRKLFTIGYHIGSNTSTTRITICSPQNRGSHLSWRSRKTMSRSTTGSDSDAH